MEGAPFSLRIFKELVNAHIDCTKDVPTAAVADQPRLERGLERDAPLISCFVALRLVYGKRAPS
eukprot:5838153-Amphidinium_carterae.1